MSKKQVNTKFWMVALNKTRLVTGLGRHDRCIVSPPNVVHDTYEKAKAEASRLAGNNVGEEYIILEATTAVSVKSPPVTTRILA